jgi:threonine/homoserine/homoserine lactone efflux protein
MGTKIRVLGIVTLGFALALLVIRWLVPADNLVLPPFYVVAGAYWLYTAWQIMTGRDAHARRVEDYLNRRRP